jgi:hypothetical protein
MTANLLAGYNESEVRLRRSRRDNIMEGRTKPLAVAETAANMFSSWLADRGEKETFHSIIDAYEQSSTFSCGMMRAIPVRIEPRADAGRIRAQNHDGSGPDPK